MLSWVIGWVSNCNDRFFFFKQKTAYEIVSRDWSSDVCSSDLAFQTIIVLEVCTYQVYNKFKTSIVSELAENTLLVVVI